MLDSLRPAHHWRNRAGEAAVLAKSIEDAAAIAALLVVAALYDKLAKIAEGWKIGERVCRKRTGEHGTILEANDKVVVKWDGGRTSHYRRDRPADVRLLGDRL